MRPLLALAILLIGLKLAAPESNFQVKLSGPLLAEGLGEIVPRADAAVLFRDVLIQKSDRGPLLQLPAIEMVDAGHDQGEEALEPQPPPLPESTGADANDHVAGSLDNVCKTLLTSAQDNDLPVPFFANLIWQESRLQHDAVSRVGAQGIAQFMPEAAAEAGLADPFDPHQAIPASARFLRALRLHFGNLGFAAAAYNAGAHRVGEWLDHGRSLPRETRTYVLRITGLSADAWRTSPPADSKLSFARRLPCRELPAFADLEDSLLRDSEPSSSTPRPDEDATDVSPRPEPKSAARRAHTARTKLAAHMAKAQAAHHVARARAQAAHHVAKARAQARKGGRTILARVAPRRHGSRTEPARPQHAGHERRRVAAAE
jgi:transglycosylase-like protein with SLT domain